MKIILNIEERSNSRNILIFATDGILRYYTRSRFKDVVARSKYQKIENSESHAHKILCLQWNKEQEKWVKHQKNVTIENT